MHQFCLPPTTQKVRMNTKRAINERIDAATNRRIKQYQGLSKLAIERRIKELDHEWDTERALETNFATLVLATSVLGYTVSKKWLALGGIAALFMLQHALQGWCPPLPIFRHLGFRTADEINQEKNALQQLALER